MKKEYQNIVSDKARDAYLSLMRTRLVLYNLKESKMKDYNITPEQAAIIAFVCEQKNPVNPSQVANYLFRKPNTISTHLNSLLKKGFITLRGDEINRTKVQIFLTDKGKKICIDSVSDDFYKQAFSVLSEKELEQLINYLDKVFKYNTQIQ